MFNQLEYRVDEGAANVPVMIYHDKEPPTTFTGEVTSTDESATGESCSILITIDTLVV